MYIDEIALREAIKLARSQPRADYTIQELPSLGTPIATDLLPIFHNGQTYAVPIAVVLALAGLGTAYRTGIVPNVPADGSGLGTIITFDTPFPTGILAVSPSIINDFQANPWSLSAPQYKNAARDQFTVSLKGGPNGSTVSISYIAFGF